MYAIRSYYVRIFAPNEGGYPEGKRFENINEDSLGLVNFRNNFV